MALPGITEGSSYGMPSFKAAGKFFARFRDDNAVLVLLIGTILDRDVLMQLDPDSFFFTEHFRDYPTVLIRLGKVPRALLKDVLREAWQAATRKAPRISVAGRSPHQ